MQLTWFRFCSYLTPWWFEVHFTLQRTQMSFSFYILRFYSLWNKNSSKEHWELQNTHHYLKKLMSYLAHGSQFYFPKSIRHVLWPACAYNEKFLKFLSVRLAASIKQELLNRGSVLFTSSQEKNHILSNEYLSEAKKRIYCYYC